IAAEAIVLEATDTLDSVVAKINDADITGISASNVNGHLVLTNDSGADVALGYTGGVQAGLGLPAAGGAALTDGTPVTGSVQFGLAAAGNVIIGSTNIELAEGDSLESVVTKINAHANSTGVRA